MEISQVIETIYHSKNT